MANRTGISWAFATFNPWIGCTKVSAGCTHCYAERDMDHRHKRAKWGAAGTRTMTTEAYWRKPLLWNKLAANGDCICCGGKGSVRGVDCWQCMGSGKIEGRPQTVFCASLADVFEVYKGQLLDSNGVPLWIRASGDTWPVARAGDVADAMHIDGYHAMTLEDARVLLFDLIDATQNLTWLVLTKRIVDATVYIEWGPEWSAWCPPSKFFDRAERSKLQPQYRGNVWLGTSVENQQAAEERMPHLSACKQWVGKTFVSAEPLLGDLQLMPWLSKKGAIDWVIAGGESGHDARPMHPSWVYGLRDQCKAADVMFHFKQWGEWSPYKDMPEPKVPAIQIDPSGRDVTNLSGMWSDLDATVYRFGVKRNGRLIDGRLHDAIPAS